MVRSHYVIALVFAVIAVAVAPAFAQPDPFATPGSGSSAGSSNSNAVDATAGPPTDVPSPTCEYITKSTCSAQDTGLLLKSGAYVAIAVLIFSLLRVWWDKRGTSTAGVRFVATLLPAAAAAAVLSYLDPARGQDLKCCLASPIFKSQILLQDSAIGRGALLGFLPAAVLFVLVAMIIRKVKG